MITLKIFIIIAAVVAVSFGITTIITWMVDRSYRKNPALHHECSRIDDELTAKGL